MRFDFTRELGVATGLATLLLTTFNLAKVDLERLLAALEDPGRKNQEAIQGVSR